MFMFSSIKNLSQVNDLTYNTNFHYSVFYNQVTQMAHTDHPILKHINKGKHDLQNYVLQKIVLEYLSTRIA